MKDVKIRTLTLTALFAALTCVATMIIKIPTPGTNGYIHVGDTFVILSGIFLGPGYGFLAAGIGSCMSDVLGGYFLYVPATFVIKGITALIISYLYTSLNAKIKNVSVKCVICGLTSTVIVTSLYMVYEWFFYGPAVLLSAPFTFVQGLAGMVLASLLLPVLLKIPVLSQLRHQKTT